MASKAVARAETPNLPDLVRTPALDIGHEDVALPKIKLAQFMTEQVKEQLVKPGCIFSATSKDDSDPIVLWDKSKGEGVLFHVLHLRKGKSVSEGGELQLYDYNDPDAPPEAWVTYNYSVALPEFDTDVPYSLLLTRTGAPAAKQLNTILKRNEVKGPAHLLAFRLTAVERENAKGKFYVPRITQVEPTAEGVAVANNLATVMSGSALEATATGGSEPAI